MKNGLAKYLFLGMIAGAVFGVILGYFLGNIALQIKFLGVIFLNALKMVVVPLIVASIIVGVTSLGDLRKLGRTAAKTILYYLATTGFAVLIGLILVNIIRPGVGVPPIGAAIPDFVPEAGQKSIIDVIVNLVPDNIFAAAANGQILPLIIFSILFGGVLTALGRKAKTVVSLFEGINLAIMKIVMIIIYFAPIGIFALVSGIVAENRASVHQLFAALGLYSVTVIAGLIIHGVVVLPLILWIIGKRNPFRYFVNMLQALATAFSTASSSATLPFTMESVEDKNKVDPRAAAFVLPLGATVNMDGTALYEAVAALFIAQIYGIDLTLGAQVVVFFTATLASIGAAAIPEAGLVMMSLVLTAVGLPLEGIGVILAIDWFLDRCRTTVNVWGDSVGAAVIGESAEIKALPGNIREVKSYDLRKKGYEPVRAAEGGYIRADRENIDFRQSRMKNGRKRDRGGGETRIRYDNRQKHARKIGSGRIGGRDQQRKRRTGDIPAAGAGKKETPALSAGHPDRWKQPANKADVKTTQPSGGVANHENQKFRGHVGHDDGSTRPKDDGGDINRAAVPGAANLGTPETDKTGGDEYFDVEFSKIKLFNEANDEGSQDTPDHVTGEKTETEKAEAADKTAKKSPTPEEDEKEDIPDAWGRDKKKRPFK
jgi:solute carrier family 1 (high affinity glutamate transporter) protein 1